MNVAMRRALFALLWIVVLAVLGVGLVRAFRPQPSALQGQVEAQETNVSAKIAGRVGRVLVQPGQMVAAGDVLFELDSPEVAAKLAQAENAQQAAQAVSAKAEHGARPEEIEMARTQWQRAVTGAELAKATLQRVQSLFDEGLIARQKRDEAEAQSRAADEQAKAAQAQYAMARQGARSEDKAAAAAQARQVGGVVAEVQVARAETRIVAPAAGEVARVQIQPGELAPQGFPVVTLVNLADPWVVLSVREDELAAFGKGSLHHGQVIALKRAADFRVTAVAVLPDFATWRAAKPGGADLRTFEIRLKPTAPIDGLRPGMSVLFDRP
jgi:HlyD family secretion protein